MTDEQRKAYLQDLAQNPVLQEILDKAIDGQWAAWKGTAPDGVQDRELCYHRTAAIEWFVNHLNTELTRLIRKE